MRSPFTARKRVGRTGRSGVLAGLLIAGMAAIAPAQGQGARGLVEGTLASRDYVAPIDFVVVDTGSTVTTAAAAGEYLPLVVRLDESVAATVVTEFDAAFRSTRAAFLQALTAAFGEATIGSREINSSRFRSFRSEFQAANPLFPVHLVLAQTWAKGYDGESTRERLAGALRAAMSENYIADLRPASTVFVVTLDRRDRIRTWGEASSHARAINRAEVSSIESAGQQLRQSLDVLDRSAGGFLTGMLRANLVEDTYLTGLLLQERLGDKVAARAYQRGEFIVQRNAPIDRTASLALAQLDRMGLEPETASPASVVAVTPPAPAIVAPPQPRSVLEPDAAPVATRPVVSWHKPALIGGAGLLAAVLAFGLWRVVRGWRRAKPSRQWLEPTAPAASGNVREAMIPHLARELKNRLVQALFAQRQALLHNEAAASQRVAVLEERLAKLQPAIAEKIRGYEQRIQALEAEIEEKDQETRDLLRAKLVLARKELDAEITRHHVDWN